MGYSAGNVSRRYFLLAVLHAAILVLVAGIVENTLHTYSIKQTFAGLLVDPLGNPIPGLTLVGVALFYLKTGVPGVTKVTCDNCGVKVASGRLHCRNCGEVTKIRYFKSEFAWLIIGYSLILTIMGVIAFVVAEETGIEFLSSTLAGSALLVLFFGWMLVGGVSLFTFGIAYAVGFTYITLRS